MTTRVQPSRGWGRPWRRLCTTVGMLALVPAVGARLEAQRFDYSATLSAARGSFVFAEPTTSWVLTQGLVFDAERWRLGADLPVIRQNSSAVTFIGGIPLPTGGPNSDAVRYRTGGSTVPTQGRRGSGGPGAGAGLVALAPVPGAPTANAVVDSGFVEAPGAFVTRLGDPVLHAATELALGAGGATRLGATVLAKLPVADPATGVGTGEFDWGAGLSVSHATPRTFVFADVSHWVLGDLPDFPLRDMTSGSAGVGMTFGEMGRVSTLASVSGATAIVDNVDPPLSAGVSVGLQSRERRFVTLGVTLGLSESAPDWSVALGWRTTLAWR